MLTLREGMRYVRSRPESISIRTVALSHLMVWGWFHACRPYRLRSVDGLSAAARVPHVRGHLSGRLQGSFVFVSRSIPYARLCPTHAPRELARHRNLAARDAAEAVSRGISEYDRAQHAGRGERESRLAHLRRLRPCTSHGSGIRGVRAALCARPGR